MVVKVNLGRRESKGADALRAQQCAGSSAQVQSGMNAVLTAGTPSRRGTRLSCVPSMLGSWEVKVFYST